MQSLVHNAGTASALWKRGSYFKSCTKPLYTVKSNQLRQPLASPVKKSGDAHKKVKLILTSEKKILVRMLKTSLTGCPKESFEQINKIEKVLRSRAAANEANPIAAALGVETGL